MRRREFIAGTVATAALSFGRRACAQTDARLPVPKRIAFVHSTEKPDELTINGRRSFRAYFEELNRLGYVEGKNLVVERYSALGRLDHYEDVARAVIASQPDLIVALNGPLALQFKPLTSTIPILSTPADPVVAGLVTNLARPGGNITGVSVDPGWGDVWGKRIQFLNETASNRLRNVCYFAGLSLKWWEEAGPGVQKTAQGSAIHLGAVSLNGNAEPAEYERVFDTMARDRIDGLLVGDSGEHITNRQLIVDLTAKYHLPAIYPWRDFVDVGGLLSYGTDLTDIMRRLADITDQVLRGAKPGEIPIYQQTKFELVLNRTTAKSLGLEFPPTLLAVADEVIG